MTPNLLCRLMSLLELAENIVSKISCLALALSLQATALHNAPMLNSSQYKQFMFTLDIFILL